MSQKFFVWNEQLNGLPRKLLLLAITFGLAALCLWALPYVWPLAAAWAFSGMLEPFVRLASKGFLRLSVRKGRAAATIVGMLMLFGLVGAAFFALIGWLWQELTGLIRTLPQLMEYLNVRVLPSLRSLYERFSLLLPQRLPEILENSILSLGQSAVKAAGSFSAWLTSGAWSTAASIPQALLSLVVLLSGTYYLTADRQRIASFWQRTFPTGILKRSRLIRANMWSALMGQLRSQLMISLVVMFFLMVCLGISGIRYGVVIGMLIGLADALPILGAGVFLIPWSLASFLTGQTGLGITLACLYAGAIIIRQILEPRLIGRQLGLYPLAAMTAMYVGYRFLGFAGLLLGPLMLSLAKAVLDADKFATQDLPSTH